MKASDPFAECLNNSHELESFFHDFITEVAKRRPKPGAEVTKYAEELRLKIPTVLKGEKITWAGPVRVDAADDEAGQTLVFARSGNAEALGFTIGCINVGRFKICLECGWLYCRIVIKGRF